MKTDALHREADAFLEPVTTTDASDAERRAVFDAEVSQDSMPLGQVRWTWVMESGVELLRGSVKDLRVASYTAVALFRTRGVDGLVIGLLVVNGLLDRYWDTLLPSRLRGRMLALEWLLDRLVVEATEYRPRLADLAGWAPLHMASERLQARAEIRFGTQAPSFTAWTAELERLRRLDVVPAESGQDPPDVEDATGPDELRDDPPTAMPGPPGPPTSSRENPPTSPAAVIAEERHLEIALARRLVERVGVPLYVLIRAPNTRPLLERLGRHGPAEPAQDASTSEMWVDYRLGPGGAAVPLSVVVTLHGDDFRCQDPRKRVRLSRGHDAPLLTFFVAPRVIGPVSLVVEVKIEDDVVGSEHIWRVCVDRTAAPDASSSAFTCQSALLHPRQNQIPRSGRTAEYRLHELLVRLFTPDEFLRWIRLNFREWSGAIPQGSASLNEMAFALVDSGARHGLFDEEFFATLESQFPRRCDVIESVRGLFADAG